MTVTRRLSYQVVSVVHIMSGLTALLVETLKVSMSWKEGQTMLSLGRVLHSYWSRIIQALL